MKWVNASERVPDLWVHNPEASEKRNLKLWGKYAAIGRYIKNEVEEYFEISGNDRLNKESFHLVEWLDETA